MYAKSYRFFICILIMLFLLSGSALPDDVLDLADRLMEEGYYDEAITEYKRFVFFAPGDESTSYALYKMGLAYRAIRRWQDAIDAFNASIAQDSKTAAERRITLAATLIASGNYSLARLELLELSESSEYAPIRLKSLYFDGIASLYMFDWAGAEASFGSFYSKHPDDQIAKRADEVNLALLKARESYKSATLAIFLSTILPGSGQIYAGDWRDGLNALALNSLTLWLLANAVYRKDYADAALVFPISMRYYLGNRYRADVDVKKHNERLDRQNALKILNLVRADEP